MPEVLLLSKSAFQRIAYSFPNSRCFKCGHYGNHTAAKCKTSVGAEKACYGCHAADHLVADCPKKVNFKNGNKIKKNGAEGSDTDKEAAKVESTKELKSKTQEKEAD